MVAAQPWPENDPTSKAFTFPRQRTGNSNHPRLGLDGAGEPRAGEPRWLPPVLRMMADTQSELANRLTTKLQTVLAELKLEEFRGGRETTTHQHRNWRNRVQITQRLHGLSDSEMALTIYTQVKGRAKQLLEVLEVTDLEKPGGLTLDGAHERMEHKRTEDAYAAWE